MVSERLDEAHWQQIYDGGSPGWDLGAASPPLAALVAAPPAWLRPGASVLHPGAGLGHDAALFAAHGYAVTAVDFAPTAVAELRRKAAKEPRLAVVAGDLFELPEAHDEAYDYILEHTCFCAVEPARRAAWFATMRRLLRPGGILLGLFYRFEADDGSGPPFAISEDEFLSLATVGFEVVENRVPSESIPRRAGRERLVALRKAAD